MIRQLERAEKAEAALERVRAMHQRVEICNSDGTHFQWECERCGYDDAQWPCATIQAIDGDADLVQA